MVNIKFGSTEYKIVTRGSLGTKSVIPSDVFTLKPKNPPIKLRLSPKKETLLKQHSKIHSKRHMNYMRQTMLLGLDFKSAHQRANQFIGR